MHCMATKGRSTPTGRLILTLSKKLDVAFKSSNLIIDFPRLDTLIYFFLYGTGVILSSSLSFRTPPKGQKQNTTFKNSVVMFYLVLV